jgi:hypothetical protein
MGYYIMQAGGDKHFGETFASVYPEYRQSRFLRNVGNNLLDLTASNPQDIQIFIAMKKSDVF